MKKYDLQGKTVVLTGVTSGIGKSLAKELICKYDCKVIGIGRSTEKIKKLKNELNNKSEQLITFTFDVSSLQNWENFVTELKEKKLHVDMLINNAGILPKFDKFENVEINDLKQVLDTNFMASVYSCKLLFPLLMKSSSPAIINVSSSISLCPLPGTTAYASSKSALKFFTESLVEEYKKQMFIAYVCPGTTKTEIFRNQNCKIEDKVNKFASTSEQVAKSILNNIKKRKNRIIVGKDAKLMDFFYRHFPKTFSHTCSKMLKKSKVKMYENVFKD